MNFQRCGWAYWFILASSSIAWAESKVTSVPGDEMVHKALYDEMDRSMKKLSMENEAAPYYIAYTVIDFKQSLIEAEFGASKTQNESKGRNLGIDLRVGNPNRDNGNFWNSMGHARPSPLPLEDDYQMLRRKLWLRTDEVYKAALEVLAQKYMTEKHLNKSGMEDQVNLAPAKAAKTVNASKLLNGDMESERLAQIVIQLSGIFRDYPDIQESIVRGRAESVRTRILTSDGHWRDEQKSYVQLSVNVNTQANDGTPIRSWANFNVAEVRDLPEFSKLEIATRSMVTELLATQKAPKVESGNAVVLFEAPAAARLMRRLLSDHLSGTPAPLFPQPQSMGQPEPGSGEGYFSGKLGQQVGPTFLHVFDDPRSDMTQGNHYLFGSYRADDEAVPAEKVELIQNGILKNLYMSRTPRKEISLSNGHGRGAAIAGAIRGGPGVLFIQSTKATYSDKELRAQALQEAKTQGGKTKVYIVKQVDTRQRNTVPLIMFHLLPDGKEEPVRGANLGNLIPRSLKNLIAMGKTPFTNNVMGDVYSYAGGVYSSVVCPALVFKDVEITPHQRVPPRLPNYPHPYFVKTAKN